MKICSTRSAALAAAAALILAACGGGSETATPAPAPAPAAPAESAPAPRIDYPTREVSMIVPFSAGGSTDLAGRIVAAALSERWGVPVTVVNNAGGNTVPAVSDMMAAAPDGYTVLMDNQPASSMIDVVVTDLPFKVSDRTFIAIAMQTPMIFITSKDSPFQSLTDVAEAAKQRPVTWTSLGGAGAQDMAFRQFFASIGVEISDTRPVALPGGADAVTQSVGGNIEVGVGSWPAIRAFHESGDARVLAVADTGRFFPPIDNVPTAIELGFNGVVTQYWIGFSGPPGLNPEIVEIWDEAIRAVLADPKVGAELKAIGVVPRYDDAEAMARFVVEENALVRKLFSN